MWYSRNDKEPHNIGQKEKTTSSSCFKFSGYPSCICDRLLRIDWSRLRKLVISIDSFDYGKELLSIIRQCIQVTHLEIGFPQCGNGIGKPSYAEFMKGVSDLENLSVLEIVGRGSLPFYDALLELIQDLGCRPITDLILMGFYCSDQMVDAIIDHLPRLRSLEIDMTNCTPESLDRLAIRMGQQLETLKYRSYRGVIDDVVRAIVPNMIDLQCLHLDYLTNISSEDFIRLGDLRKLKELVVTGRRVESEIIKTWSHQGFGSCMVTLKLKLLGDGISSETMGAFLRNMPRLRSMKLARASDDILQAIAQSCPNLIELNLVGTLTITSTAVQFVIDHCSQLKTLNVFDRIGRHNEWFPAALTVGKYRKITFKSVWEGYA